MKLNHKWAYIFLNGSMYIIEEPSTRGLKNSSRATHLSMMVMR